jgi:glycosyltransferase involved in cell wall biosynthesis
VAYLAGAGDRVIRESAATISVVIPTLNEEANLPHVFARMPACVDELVIVDGHSTDDTVEVARALRPDARILLQSGKGKSNALACGFAAARGDIIVMIDADGSPDPAEIPDFVRPLLDGADFATGSRFMEGAGSVDITPLRGLGHRALCGMVNLLFGTRYTDISYNYNAFWRYCLVHMHATLTGEDEIEALMSVRVARAGFRVAEVPSMELERLYGEPTLSNWRYARWVFAAIVKERFRVWPTQTLPSEATGRLMRFVSAFLPGADGAEWLEESDDHLRCVAEEGGRLWPTRLQLIGGLIRYVPRAWLREIAKRLARRS